MTLLPYRTSTLVMHFVLYGGVVMTSGVVSVCTTNVTYLFLYGFICGRGYVLATVWPCCFLVVDCDRFMIVYGRWMA